MNSTALPVRLNGMEIAIGMELLEKMRQDPNEAKAGFQVATGWHGGSRTSSQVAGWSLGDQYHERNHIIASDEPIELNGDDAAANPAELFLASLNTCVLLSFVTLCTLESITVRNIEVDCEGEIDLRGFFDLAEGVPVGYPGLKLHVKVSADADEATMRRIHAEVVRRSVVFQSVSNAVPITDELTIA